MLWLILHLDTHALWLIFHLGTQRVLVDFLLWLILHSDTYVVWLLRMKNGWVTSPVGLDKGHFHIGSAKLDVILPFKNIIENWMIIDKLILSAY